MLISVFFSLLPNPLAAQDDAKRKFEAGIDAFHSGDYPAALDSFESSYAIRPMPKVLFNVAMCYKAMYRYKEALEAFKRFVETADLPIDDPLYREVLTERSELLSKVGQLEITSTPTGATVLIDGASVGQTPLSPPRPVDPGKHAVVVEMEGFAPYRREVTVTSGATLQLEAKLETEQGTVEIRCPLDASIILNGEDIKTCPFIGKLPAKSHQMTLMIRGVAPIERIFVLRPNERLLLDLSSSLPVYDSKVDNSSRIHGTKKRNRLLFLLGGISSALAAGAGALGTYFVVQWNKAYDEGLEAIDTQNRERYDEIDQKRLPAHRLGATVSFVTCGVLLAAGSTLMMMNREKNEYAKKNALAFEIGVSGVQIQF